MTEEAAAAVRPYQRRAGVDPVLERVRAQELWSVSEHSSDSSEGFGLVVPDPSPAPVPAPAPTLPLAADERLYHRHTRRAQHYRWPAGNFFLVEPLAVGCLVTVEPVVSPDATATAPAVNHPTLLYVVESIHRTHTKTATRFDAVPLAGPLGEPRRGVVRVNLDPAARRTFHVLFDSVGLPHTEELARAYHKGVLTPPPRGSIRWVFAGDSGMRDPAATERRESYTVHVGNHHHH